MFSLQTDASVGTEMGTMTEPECIGPLDPGTSVTLEGIVWHETDGGMVFIFVVSYIDISNSHLGMMQFGIIISRYFRCSCNQRHVARKDLRWDTFRLNKTCESMGTTKGL